MVWPGRFSHAAEGGWRQLKPSPDDVWAPLLFPCPCRFLATFLTGTHRGLLVGQRARRRLMRQTMARRWYVSDRRVKVFPSVRQR